MNIADLIFYMQCGEEIEFRILEKTYFLQPDYKRFNKNWNADNPPYPFTIIYDSSDYNSPKEIFVGNTYEIINYEFQRKYTMKNNLDKFEFVF